VSACPACGGPLVQWIEVPAFEPGDRRLFPLLRCDRCLSAVTGGEPPGPHAYASGLYEDLPPPGVITRARRLALRQPVRWLRRAGLRPGARVLDVGAGRGLLVEALRGTGFDARGIDPAGRAPAGARVERRTLEEHTDRDLDAVVLWHVLEHLADPRAALERVHGWLRTGGLVLVGVPNLASWQRLAAGERWLHYDVPRHRVHLTPAGLRALLRGGGFEPGTVRHFVWEQNPIGMALVRRPARALRAARRGPAGAAALGLAVGLAVPVEAGAAVARRGGTVACVAVRRANDGQ
jgi:SAM-dependent methyltransferase